MVSLSAILVLGLVGVSAIVVFRPTVSESRTEASASSDQVEMIQNLRQLVDEQAAKHATNISMLKDQHSKAIQKIQTQLNRSNITIKEMQQQQIITSVKTDELENQLNESKLTRIEE